MASLLRILRAVERRLGGADPRVVNLPAPKSRALFRMARTRRRRSLFHVSSFHGAACSVPSSAAARAEVLE